MTGDIHQARVEIPLDDEVERNAYRCPLGHTSWEPTNEHWYCPYCARNWDADGDFDYLIDDRTRERYKRDEVVLTYADGTTYRDAHGKEEEVDQGLAERV